MLENYFPVLIFVIVAIGFGFVPLIAGFLLGPNKPDKEKNSPYECGFAPFENARMHFDVRYYLIAILFILFDLEIAFLFPWAATFRHIVQFGQQAWYVLSVVGVFLAILVIGYIAEWKNGALDWE